MKITKVVRYDQVEQMTERGWLLVCNVQNQRIDTQKEMEQQSHSDGRGAWVPEKYKVTTAVVNETLFVLEKEADAVSREAELEKRWEEQRDAHREDKIKLREASGMAVEATKELEKAKHQLTVEQLGRREEAERAKAHNLKAQKLEEDLGKIRDAIGKLKFNEITGRQG